MSNFHQYDDGTLLECPIKEKGEKVDLTNANQVEIVINTRTRAIVKTADITDRVNGLCQIELTADDLSEVGRYKVQGIVSFNNGTDTFHSDIQQFTVDGNLKKTI